MFKCKVVTTWYYVTTDSSIRWYNHVRYGRSSWRKQREGKTVLMYYNPMTWLVGIINWVEREAQKLCGQSPYYIVRWIDRIETPSRSSWSITWSLVTLSSDQPMTSRHACVLRPPQVTCDRNKGKALLNIIQDNTKFV